MASIVMEGIPQEGPLLSEVLKHAGATNFKQITITGVQENKTENKQENKSKASGLTLTKDQITGETILDFANNRPTMKLASTAIPKSDWVQDITTIKVE